MRVALRHQQHHLVLDVHPEGGAYRVVVDGAEHLAEAVAVNEATLIMTVDGRRFRVALARNGPIRLVAVGGETYAFVPESGTPAGHSVAGVASPEVTAPMPGKILQVLVRAGDRVAAGDGLLILEAMKMENRLIAEALGVVAEVRVAAGDMVDGGQVLVVLTYELAP